MTFTKMSYSALNNILSSYFQLFLISFFLSFFLSLCPFFFLLVSHFIFFSFNLIFVFSFCFFLSFFLSLFFFPNNRRALQKKKGNPIIYLSTSCCEILSKMIAFLCFSPYSSVCYNQYCIGQSYKPAVPNLGYPYPQGYVKNLKGYARVSSV